MEKYIKAIEDYKRLIEEFPRFEDYYKFAFNGILAVARHDSSITIEQFTEILNIVEKKIKGV